MPLYQGIIGGGSSPVEDLSPVLLWTNPAPTDSFAGQKVELDLTEYEGILVEYYGSTANPNIVNRSYFKKNEFPTSGYYIGGGMNDTSGRTRNINALDNTGVTFSSGFNDSSIANTIMLPYRIYGIKKYVVEPTVGTTLWTNPNPSVAFETQDVNLDLTNYDAVEIECMGSTGAASYKQKTILYKEENVRQGLMMYQKYNNVEYYSMRAVDVKNNGIHFYGGANHPFTGGRSEDDTSCIPLTIKGVKFK